MLCLYEKALFFISLGTMRAACPRMGTSRTRGSHGPPNVPAMPRALWYDHMHDVADSERSSP